MSIHKKKYVFNSSGALKVESGVPGSTTVAKPNEAVTIICSIDDAIQASTDCGDQFRLTQSTQRSIETMQDDSYIQKFGVSAPGGPNLQNLAFEGSNIIDGLTRIFSEYEVPIGLISKLQALTSYRLNFIIDDSGSMKIASDLLLSKAVSYVRTRKQRFLSLHGDPTYMTRYEEAENRLHIMFDFLAYIPTGIITMSSLNNSAILTLTRDGKTPEQFAEYAHQQIMQYFSNQVPTYQTPTYRALYNAFYSNMGHLTIHYLFTDGVPNCEGQPNENVTSVSQLIKDRPNPYYNALTLISCTNVDEECEWMKIIEENSPYTSELDDFESEKQEILKDQGPVFPFTYGFWLLCHFVAAINPDDLDALDESFPLTRFVFSNLIGRELTPQEYANYWGSHPKAMNYHAYYQQFATETSLMAKQILHI